MQTTNDSAAARGPDLYALLYTSRMAAPDAQRVAEICERSRDNNRRDAITGLLVFDGQAFCQYVEGAQAAMTALRDRLERDTRHVAMHVLGFGPAESDRRFPSWRLGYAFTADPSAIARIETAERRGADALKAFARWLRALDVGAPVDG